MRRISFSLGLGLFAVYSYGATIVSAAWFLRRDHDATFGTSLAWAALLYAPTVLSGLLVWRVLRLFGAEWRAIGVLTALTPLVTALSAWASTIVDGAFRGAHWTGGEIAARIIATACRSPCCSGPPWPPPDWPPPTGAAPCVRRPKWTPCPPPSPRRVGRRLTPAPPPPNA